MSEEEIPPTKGRFIHTMAVWFSVLMIAWCCISFAGWYSDNLVVISENESVEITDIPIVNLHETTSIRGSFYIGSGTVGESGVYVYYVDLGNSTFRRKTVPADYTDIVKDEEESPYIRMIQTMETKCARTRCVSTPTHGTLSNPRSYLYEGNKRWEIHVPNSTLVTDPREMRVGS